MNRRTRKQLSAVVTVSYPPEWTAAMARREIRTLIREGTGYYGHPDDGTSVTLRQVSPASWKKGNKS